MTSEELTSWLTARLPADWFEASPQISLDRDEAIVVGQLAAPAGGADPAGEQGCIDRFREETRERRMVIAAEAERRFGRRLAWGASCGSTRVLFTHLAVPVMTRLRQPERMVLDTLVEAGVARSRSHALAWCVRLVGEHSEDWLAALRGALHDVERLRAEGPQPAA